MYVRAHNAVYRSMLRANACRALLDPSTCIVIVTYIALLLRHLVQSQQCVSVCVCVWCNQMRAKRTNTWMPLLASTHAKKNREITWHTFPLSLYRHIDFLNRKNSRVLIQIDNRPIFAAPANLNIDLYCVQLYNACSLHYCQTYTLWSHINLNLKSVLVYSYSTWILFS